MVAVDGVQLTGAPVPVGGVEQSGLGRQGARHGLEETHRAEIRLGIAEAA